MNRSLLARLVIVVATAPLVVLGMAALWAATFAPVPRRGHVRITVWGLPSGEDNKGLAAQIAEFERRTGIEVKNLSMGAGNMNAQKLMTSIVGGVPPDLVRQDRFRSEERRVGKECRSRWSPYH